MKAELRAAGYDPDRPEPMYSVVTHKACLEIARAHLFAGDTPEEGFRKLGRLWVEGFAKNAVGMVLAAGARLMGVERALARIPGYMKVGRSDLELDIQALGPRYWLLTAEDKYKPMPYLTAGCVEAILEMAGARSHTVDVDKVTAETFEVHIRWS